MIKSKTNPRDICKEHTGKEYWKHLSTFLKFDFSPYNHYITIPEVTV